MTDDKELQDWRSEWQSLGGDADFADALTARATRDGQRMRRAAGMEVLGGAVSSLICVWLMVRTHGMLAVVCITGAILLFNGAWLTHFFMLRANLFRASGEGVDAFVTLTRKRLATERQWTRFARRWTIAIGAAVLPWAIWVFIANYEAYRAAPWRGIVGYGGVAAIFAAVFLWTRIKERKLIADEERFERQLADVKLP